MNTPTKTPTIISRLILYAITNPPITIIGIIYTLPIHQLAPCPKKKAAVIIPMAAGLKICRLS
ncbi:TPA: hypothetical protein DIS57_04795 [Candidatus Wolfebacteria bacterium]|nr:hypothetical protein [Candidatus Wolfebacteria bacterium]